MEFPRIKRLPAVRPRRGRRAQAPRSRRRRRHHRPRHGEPDGPTPDARRREAGRGRANPRNHRYSVSRGFQAPFRHPPTGTSGATAWPRPRHRGDRHHRREGRHLPPRAARSSAPGDVVVCPDPTYPIHPYSVIIPAATCAMPLAPVEGFIGRLARRSRRSWPQPKLLILNLPAQSDDGGGRSLDFFEEDRAISPASTAYS